MKKILTILVICALALNLSINVSAAKIDGTAIGTATFTQDVYIDIVDVTTDEAWSPVKANCLWNYVILTNNENVAITVDPIEGHIEECWYNAGTIHVIISFVGGNREFFLSDQTTFFINGNPAVMEKEGDQIYQIAYSPFPATVVRFIEIVSLALNMLLHLRMITP